MASHKILPVVVIYQCQINESTSYNSFLVDSPFEEIFVYDNSPVSFDFVQSNLPKNAIYVRDVNNGGLSKAYNSAAHYALQNNYTHILLLDQDTLFPKDVLLVYEAFLRDEVLCAPLMLTKHNVPFSPTKKQWCGTTGVKLTEGVYSLHQFLPVNSGMCIPVDHFFKCGGYNEQVRLDFADFEFLSRYRNYFPQFRLLPIQCYQDFSNDEVSIEKLRSRFMLYLKSAKAAKWQTNRERIFYFFEVLRHTLALTCRTRNITFITAYFKFIFT